MLHLFYSGPQPVLWCKRELTRGKTTTWWKVFQIHFEQSEVWGQLTRTFRIVLHVSANLKFKHFNFKNWKLFSIWASGQRQRWFPLHGGVCQGLQVGRKLHRQIARCPHFAHFSEHGVNISKEEVALYFSSKVPVWNDVTQSRMGPIQPLILKQPVNFSEYWLITQIFFVIVIPFLPLSTPQPSWMIQHPYYVQGLSTTIDSPPTIASHTTNLTNSMEGQWTQKGDQPIMNPVIF